ncbi:MAG: hypothetical protein ACU0GG_19815 [Paracoccaceae bacterium]
MRVFLSVGSPKDEEQEKFIAAFETRLRHSGFLPQTVGRDYRTNDRPIVQIKNLMASCDAVAVLALERTFIETGAEKRGGDDEKPLTNVILPTAWNQVEAALAYSNDKPLLMVVEKGIRLEGFIDFGNDWFVHQLEPHEGSLQSSELASLLSDWRLRAEARSKSSSVRHTESIDQLGLGQILARLTLSSWAALIAILSTLVALAYWFGSLGGAH